jgi:hypothetical protein
MDGKTTVKVLSKRYLRSEDQVLCHLIYSLKPGDIFSVTTLNQKEVQKDTYLVLSRKLSRYDETLGESWETPVPIYTLINLLTNGEYTGIIPGGPNNLYIHEA